MIKKIRCRLTVQAECQCQYNIVVGMISDGNRRRTRTRPDKRLTAKESSSVFLFFFFFSFSPAVLCTLQCQTDTSDPWLCRRYTFDPWHYITYPYFAKPIGSSTSNLTIHLWCTNESMQPGRPGIPPSGPVRLSVSWLAERIFCTEFGSIYVYL